MEAPSFSADLPGNEIHLWYVTSPYRPEHSIIEYKGLLANDERERYARLRSPRDQTIYLIARLCVRLTLSRYTGVHPSCWRFVRNAYGRPSIARPEHCRGLRFNVAHTDGCVVFVVAHDMNIGVDVERNNRPGLNQSLAAEFLSDAEIACLTALPPSRRQARVTKYWTLKEAYAKAKGLGLSLPFKSFTFGFDRDDIFLRDTKETDRHWTFQVLAPSPGFTVGLAAGSKTPARPTLRVFRLDSPSVMINHSCTQRTNARDDRGPPGRHSAGPRLVNA